MPNNQEEGKNHHNLHLANRLHDHHSMGTFLRSGLRDGATERPFLCRSLARVPVRRPILPSCQSSVLLHSTTYSYFTLLHSNLDKSVQAGHSR